MTNNLLCELQVRYRRKGEIGVQQIKSSADADLHFRKIMQDEMMIREMLVALYLNRANFVIGYHVCSIGSKTCTLVDNKVILSTGLLCGATSIVIAHNHPSGQCSPSTEDYHVTNKLVNGCAAVGIQLLDSMVIVESGFYSFADEGSLTDPLPEFK